jgi:hypothetical protein
VLTRHDTSQLWAHSFFSFFWPGCKIKKMILKDKMQPQTNKKTEKEMTAPLKKAKS